MTVIRPRPYTAAEGWTSLSESELFAAYAHVSAAVEGAADDLLDRLLRESDELQAQDPDGFDGIDLEPFLIPVFAADAHAEETCPPRGGPGSGVCGGLLSAEGRR